MNSTIQNPAIPYAGSIPGSLQPGQIIRIHGTVDSAPTCFAVNLQSGPNAGSRGDVALHLSPVFSPPPRLVRNSIQNQQWGPEESHGSYFPFVAGQGFEILILTESDHFKIAINGQHFTEFQYRLPLHVISHLAIDGDVSVNTIKFEPSSRTLSPSHLESGDGVTMPIGFVDPDMKSSITPAPQSYHSDMASPSGAPPLPYPTAFGPQPSSTSYAPQQSSNPYVPPRSSSPYGPPPSSPYGPSPTNPYGPSLTNPYGPPPSGNQYGPSTNPYGPPPGGNPYGPQSSSGGYPSQHGVYPTQAPGGYPSQGYPGQYPSQQGPYPGTSVVYPGQEKSKSDSSSFAPLAAGAAALAGAAGAALMGGKHKGGKHGHSLNPAAALMGGGHGGPASLLAGGMGSILGGSGKHGHKSGSNPIPIGGVMAGGAAALAGAYMLSKSPMGKILKPKKMKKLYKHKHKGGWGSFSSSSSSSSDE